MTVAIGSGVSIGAGWSLGSPPGIPGPGTPFFVAGSQAEWHSNPGIGDSYGEWRNTGTAADNVLLYTHQYTSIDVQFFTCLLYTSPSPRDS